MKIYKAIVQNHAELTELCNAISTLSYSLANYVWAFDLKNNNIENSPVHVNTGHEIDENKGYFMFEIKKGITQEISCAFDFFYISILMLKEEYPAMIEVSLIKGN